MTDRFGLGWRDELAASIWSNLDRIDVVEVLADDYLDAPRTKLRALRTLARQVPLTLHGTGLGLASTEPVDPHRLRALARVVHAVEPEFWSEHFAFVRGGGVEIGHLAAPPRTRATIEGTARNVESATRTIGTRPVLENIATLVDPPHSEFGEAEWIAASLEACRVPLLLDLHNLHANATNFGFDAVGYLDRIPMECVAQVHLAGGHWISRGATRRLLDDHVHDVPDPVYALLEELAARRAELTIILERDGDYPDFGLLLAQLDRARMAVAAGRARRPRPGSASASTSCDRAVQLSEATLARIYVDPIARADWIARQPRIDAAGIEMAAESFARKRQLKRTS